MIPARSAHEGRSALLLTSDIGRPWSSLQTRSCVGGTVLQATVVNVNVELRAPVSSIMGCTSAAQASSRQGGKASLKSQNDQGSSSASSSTNTCLLLAEPAVSHHTLFVGRPSAHNHNWQRLRQPFHTYCSRSATLLGKSALSPSQHQTCVCPLLGASSRPSRHRRGDCRRQQQTMTTTAQKQKNRHCSVNGIILKESCPSLLGQQQHLQRTTMTTKAMKTVIVLLAAAWSPRTCDVPSSRGRGVQEPGWPPPLLCLGWVP
mmetsp:Transcript_49178/g.104664  ORF Transcript_49178/g.104664 Transcript_49178/m.104664 type:complete len:261 (+) Transcript_49178:235-1017(+)